MLFIEKTMSVLSGLIQYLQCLAAAAICSLSAERPPAKNCRYRTISVGDRGGLPPAWNKFGQIWNYSGRSEIIRAL